MPIVFFFRTANEKFLGKLVKEKVNDNFDVSNNYWFC